MDHKRNVHERSAARRSLLAAVSAYRRLALACGLPIVVLGSVLLLLWPATYESSMKFLITRERMTTGAATATASEQVSDEEFAAKAELVLSQPVLEAVVSELNLTTGDQPPAGLLNAFRSRVAWLVAAQPDAALTTEQAASRLRESLRVTLHRESRSVGVVCRDRNPERAPLILKSLFQKYEAQLRELNEKESTGQALREQAEAFNRKLAEAQARLRRLEAQGDVTDAGLRRELLLQQYYETLSRLNATRTDLREAEQRISVLQSQLATQPARIETESRTQYTQATEQMRQELSRLEAERAQLLRRQNPDPRLVRDLDQRIERAKELIAREERAVPQERAVALNDVHQRLMNDLLAAQATQTALAERQRALTELLAQVQSHLQEAEQQRAAKSDFDRARTASEDEYLLYSRKAREAELLSVARPAALIVTLTEAPSVALRPVGPRPPVVFALVLVLGCVAACAGAYVSERRRMRLTAGADAPRAELRVLAKIPEV